MGVPTNGDHYAMGRSEAEERRLQRQAALYDPATRRLFEASGIGPGMSVLDLGSGAGDVALLAAGMVGPTGRVVGVDTNATILETARRRARTVGQANVTFVVGDIREVPLDDNFDAIVGRLILCHVPDPSALLRQLLPHLRPGGVVAFYEPDFTLPGRSYPPSALTEQIFHWLARALAFGGVETSTGMKLHQVFLDAGLEAPQIAVDALVGGSRTFIEEYTALASDTVRTVLPLLIKGGIATEQEVSIDTLAARWRDELIAQRSVIRNYLFMGAWARAA
jgi:SAM-dependent methyltransferase